MTILGIETSCDETAAALVKDGRRVLKSLVASQLEVHKPFRGVVPELASRAHVERINEVIARTLKGHGSAVHAIAVTTGPGLVGCLLVGVTTAQTWGWVRHLPVIGVNHLEGHLFAGLVEHPNLKPPFLGLIVSGGHTELVIFYGYGRYRRLGATRDDAAGEAFDKVANLLGLPFPGGPAIDRTALRGRPDAVAFPRAWIPGTWDFSFSGIKTSVANYLKERRRKRESTADLCASFQEAIVDVLVKKTMSAAAAYHLRSIVVGGGVAANSRLRARFLQAAHRENVNVYLPDLHFCTDNAAMIAAAGFYKFRHKVGLHNSLSVDANLPIRSWVKA